MEKMITFVPIGGLCNRMRAMASGVFISRKLGCDINFVWKKDRNCFACFSDLFEPVSLESVKIMPSGLFDFYLNPSRKKNLYIPGLLRKTIFDSCITGDFESQDEEIFRRISGEKVCIISGYSLSKHFPLKEIFVPVSDITESINSLKKRFKSDTVGIHIRRGDNNHSIERNSINDYIRYIDEEIKENPDVCFYLATDSPEIKNELIKGFGERIIYNDARLERTSVKGMKDAAIDLWCLASTKKIVGSFYSSFSDIAAEMGQIELRIL